MLNNHNLSNMTKEEERKLISENIQLHLDNEKLVKEQKEFQDALKEKIDQLKKLGPWKRFWGYWQLVSDLITTIEQAISKQSS